MPMTVNEKTDLVMRGMSGTFVNGISVGGWLYDDVLYILNAGVRPAEIESLVSVGAGYHDIKLIAEQKIEAAKKQHLDNIEETVFGKNPKILSGGIPDGHSAKLAVELGENAARLACRGIFKLGRLITGK